MLTIFFQKIDLVLGEKVTNILGEGESIPNKFPPNRPKCPAYYHIVHEDVVKEDVILVRGFFSDFTSWSVGGFKKVAKLTEQTVSHLAVAYLLLKDA
jgi:hypothetical protein